MESAPQLVEDSKRVCSYYVKLERFEASNVVTSKAKESAYQQAITGNSESNQQMLNGLELSDSCFEAKYTKCKLMGIGLFASGLSSDDFRFPKHFDMNYLKTVSGEIPTYRY